MHAYINHDALDNNMLPDEDITCEKVLACRKGKSQIVVPPLVTRNTALDKLFHFPVLICKNVIVVGNKKEESEWNNICFNQFYIN